MYELKAKEGNIDMTDFDLSDVINSANEEAESIEEHNRRVLSHFRELVKDYIEKANAKLDCLGLPPFDYRDFTEMSIRYSLHHGLTFGHGSGSIYMYFSTQRLDCGRLSTDFKGEITIRKNWKGHLQSAKHTYPLESVADIFDKGKDVIKYHIISRDIKDYRQKEKVLKTIDYKPN